ncbi:hypothetical protein [Tahibacter sp.]|uniref:hypothetical protein n=1 Tax=Tahibacter sp. TaxID=2056211 RepID=UPI0028C3ED2A|nr:hypothetical protein [Tahibacter sp.]
METSAVRFCDLPRGKAAHRARTSEKKPHLETRFTILPSFSYPRPEKASFMKEIDPLFPPRRRGQDAALRQPPPVRPPMARTGLPRL